MSLYLGENRIDGNSNPGALRNLGEIVASTIPLQDAGLHLLDGSSLSGSGVYSDFVDYIAGLYDTITSQNFTIPTLTENGTLGGHTFAVSASSEFSSSYLAYMAFDGSNSTYWATVSNPTLPQDYIIYNPNPLNITSFFITTRNADECATAGNVYGSNDGTTWTLITNFTNSTTTAGSTYNIDLSSNIGYYSYYKLEFTAKSSANYIVCNIDFTATYKNLFVCEAAWQSFVATYGVCGKFVYDGVNNTVRLPKIAGFTEGATDMSALLDLAEAGLPNIDGVVSYWRANTRLAGGADGAFSSSIDGAATYPTPLSTATGNVYKVDFDASRSSSIYGNSTTVQPQSIKVLYYIVVATITKTDIQVDIDEIATDLNGKMDTDGTNAVSSVKFADGQWIASASTIASSVTYPKNADLTYSLASYLPNDGYKYEVLIDCSYITTLTTGINTRIILNSDIGIVTWPTGGYASSGSSMSFGCCTIVVGTGRNLIVEAVADSAGTFSLYAQGYRRIGTNS